MPCPILLGPEPNTIILGLSTAVFLAEYAHENVRRFFKPILEVIAGND